MRLLITDCRQNNQTLEFISGYRDLETKKDTTEGTAWEIDQDNYKRISTKINLLLKSV